MSEKTAATAEAAAPAGKPSKSDQAAKPAKNAKAPQKKGVNLIFILIPVALVAAIVLAVALPPTRGMLAQGPLKPLFARFEKAPAGKGATVNADPAAAAKRLSDTVESDRKAAQAKDAQIAQLQAQVTQLQASPAPSPTPAAKATPVVVSDDVKRTAAYWSGMDADKAAEIIKALPDAYVQQVLRQMPADAVSDIMSALPAKTAARLTVDTGLPAP